MLSFPICRNAVNNFKNMEVCRHACYDYYNFMNIYF